MYAYNNFSTKRRFNAILTITHVRVRYMDYRQIEYSLISQVLLAEREAWHKHLPRSRDDYDTHLIINKIE